MKDMIHRIHRFFCRMNYHQLEHDSVKTFEAMTEVHYFISPHVCVKCKWCGFEGKTDSQGNLFS